MGIITFNEAEKRMLFILDMYATGDATLRKQ